MTGERLSYRRQFLLSREIIPALSDWNISSLRADLHLHAHPDLEVHLKERKEAKLALLGYIFDPEDHKKSNDAILSDIIAASNTFGAFLETIKRYTGQYVIIFLNDEISNVIHDPLGLREVYFCTSSNRVICGSQPNLLNEYSDPPLGITTDPAIRHFHDHELPQIRSGRFWIGDETYFRDIKHLLPNHYLDARSLRPQRYWPRERLAGVDLDESVRRCSSFLQGALRAAAHRQDLMMAVTSGTDSRTLLAASKDISPGIYYFINKHQGLEAGHPDISVPSSIFKRIGLPFHIHSLEGDIDPKFRETFLKNTFLSADLNLSAIYHVYYKEHSHRMNVLGVGEIGRTFFGPEPRQIDGFYLARSLKFKHSRYAVDQCQQWLDATLPAARQHGVNTMTLLLWEQLLGNWGVVGNSESDIAIEEFDPFNSHYLYENLLGVDKKYAKYGESTIFRELIRSMWPELLEFPINPPCKKADYVRLFLLKAGILSPLKKIAYRVDRLRFKWSQKRHA